MRFPAGAVAPEIKAATGFRILFKKLQHVCKVQPFDRIAADTDSRGLTETERGQLPDRFIGQRTGAGNDSDRPPSADSSGQDADLAFIESNEPRTVRPDQTGLFPVHNVFAR